LRLQPGAAGAAGDPAPADGTGSAGAHHAGTLDARKMTDQTPSPQTADARELHRGEFLSLRRRGHWEFASRVNSRGAAFVLAVTEARELLLVEQFRMPLQRRTIELPAGLIGDEAAFRGESAERTALREL